MESSKPARPGSGSSARLLQRHTIPVELALLAALLGAWQLCSPMGLDANDWNGLLVAAAPLAIAAMAQTLPIIAGGQGLSAGATLVLVSAFVAPLPMASPADAMAAVAIGLLIGSLVGLLNGVLIALCGMRSAPVTFATGAGCMALALQHASQGGVAPPLPLQELLFGWRLWGVSLLPPILLVAICLAGELVLSSATGAKLRQVGVAVGPRGGGAAVVLAYAVAGIAAGFGGILLAGSLGSLDSEMGAPVLLQILAAIALGGGIPGQGRGSFVGSLLGAFIVAGAGNLLVPLGISDYASTAIDAAWLFLGIALVPLACRARSSASVEAPEPDANRRWLARVALLAPLALLLFNFRPQASDLATLMAGIGLLAVGQAAVLRNGSIDLSMPAVISAAAIATVALTNGSNAALLWVLPLIALAAIIMAATHALVFDRLHRGAIAATLASAGIAQAFQAGMLVELPLGYAPSLVLQAVTARVLGLSPAAWALAALSVCAALLVGRWPRTQHRALAAYLVSGLSAAAFGVVVAGLGGTVRFGLIDTYLLPAVAAALLGASLAGADARRAVSFVIPTAIVLMLVDTVLIGWNADYAVRIGATTLIILLGEGLHAARSSRRP